MSYGGVITRHSFDLAGFDGRNAPVRLWRNGSLAIQLQRIVKLFLFEFRLFKQQFVILQQRLILQQFQFIEFILGRGNRGGLDCAGSIVGLWRSRRLAATGQRRVGVQRDVAAR